MTLPYTAILGAHTLAFVLLVGAIVVFDLRVLGFAKGLPLRDLSRLTLPVCFFALLLAVGSGVLMLNARAEDLLASRALQVKLALILAAGLNAAFFRTGPWTSVAAWNVGVAAPSAARASAALSIAIWLGVLTCGRLVAAFIRP
jgi:hypothetical protein